VYSYMTPIAWRNGDGWVMPDVKYSKQTTIHQNLTREGLRIVTSETVYAADSDG
jgi:hypothetical protein